MPAKEGRACSWRNRAALARFFHLSLFVSDLINALCSVSFKKNPPVTVSCQFSGSPLSPHVSVSSFLLFCHKCHSGIQCYLQKNRGLSAVNVVESSIWWVAWTEDGVIEVNRKWVRGRGSAGLADITERLTLSRWKHSSDKEKQADKYMS